MTFELSSKRRERLRTQIFACFDRDTFSLFASDKLGIINFKSLVPETGFESQCQAFIGNMENEGKLERLCVELRDYRANKPGLVAIVTEILVAMNAPSAGPGHRQALMIVGRPFLNRDDLRSKLTSFIEGSGLERLLFVCGEEATGKSYSRHLISHGVSGLKFVSAELPAISVGAFEASHVAGAICVRLWPESPLERFDDLGQPARDAKWYGDRLVARLEKLDRETLLFIDGFNTAPLSETAAELLVRLCRAVENNECNNLWLALIGLDAAKLGPEYEGLVEPELARAPTAKDIEDFLTEVTKKSSKPVSAAKIKVDAKKLAAVLGAKPSHARWEKFTPLLMKKCKEIRKPSDV